MKLHSSHALSSRFIPTGLRGITMTSGPQLKVCIRTEFEFEHNIKYDKRCSWDWNFNI